MHEDEEAVSLPVVPDVPVNEKGDEPLSNHKEEIEVFGTSVSEEGLSLFAKFGALAVVVAVCLGFLRSRGPKKSMA